MITLEQEPIFSLCIDGKKLPGFRIISEWEGFKKLQRGTQIVIVASNKASDSGLTPYSDMMQEFFGRKPVDEHHIIMASTDLLEQIIEAQKAQQESKP